MSRGRRLWPPAAICFAEERELTSDELEVGQEPCTRPTTSPASTTRLGLPAGHQRRLGKFQNVPLCLEFRDLSANLAEFLGFSFLKINIVITENVRYMESHF